MFIAEIALYSLFEMYSAGVRTPTGAPTPWQAAVWGSAPIPARPRCPGVPLPHPPTDPPDDGRPVPGLSGAPAHPAARPHLGAAARPTESRAGVTMQLFGAITDGHLLPTHRTEHSELPPGARDRARVGRTLPPQTRPSGKMPREKVTA